MAYRYRTVKINGKTKLLHRHVMEQVLGRRLLPTEHVHHRDGDRKNNDPANLEVMSCHDHQHHHKQKHPEIKVCQFCGTQFRPKPTKRERAKCCSWKCGHALSWRTRKAGPPVAEALVRANVVEQLAERVA